MSSLCGLALSSMATPFAIAASITLARVDAVGLALEQEPCP